MSELQRFTRNGEQEFASIHRNRSGISAGEIDYGWAPFWCQENLCDGDKQDLADTAYALYETICRYLNVRAVRDSNSAEAKDEQ